MKAIITFLLIIQCQFGFTQAKLTEAQKLITTCKVWGFLKYYHPKVANGDFNWDKQLFDVLPKIEEAKNKKEFSLVLENWINSLGEIKAIAAIVVSDSIKYFDKNFDLSWINEDHLFSKKVSQKLKFIEENRLQGKQFYLGVLRAGNIFVKNEDYTNINFNDKNARILGLFMYWNLIEYFYPYKYVMDQKWDKTLKELLPTFIEAKTEDDFYTAMQKLIIKLNDSHVVFFKYPKKQIKYFPAKCKIIDEKMIITEILVDSLSYKPGDVITKIDDKTIKEIVLENRNLVGGSNEAAYLDNVVKKVLSGSFENLIVEFLKDGKSETKTMSLYPYEDIHKNDDKKRKKKVKFKILDNNIGCVDMEVLLEKNVPEMIEKLKSTKAIIFDMRNYPNNTYKAISKFLNAKEKTFAIYTEPDLSYPGRFRWTKGTSCGSENSNNYKGKVVLLLNEESMSQAEWTAMCFQTAGNTTIIGSQTAGADGNVSDFDLMKAFYSRFSGIGVYYPDGRETQRIGIVSDIEVKPTIKGIQEGKDEVLDRALQFIQTGK